MIAFRPDVTTALRPVDRPPRPWRSRWQRATADCRRWLLRRPRQKNPSPIAGNSSQDSATDPLAASLGALRQATAELPSLSRDLEQRFLAIGGVLEQLPAISDALVQHARRLVSLALGQGEGESLCRKICNGLQEPLGFVDTHRTTAVQLAGQLQEVLRGIDAMLRKESDLGRTVAPLKYIQTLFKVEAAALDASLQGMFLALTGEISNLQQKVSETFGEKFQILRETRQTVRDVLGHLGQQDARLGQSLDERKRGLKQTLAGLEADLQRNQQREAKLTQVSETIAREVSALVFGLQTQDIVAQKVAHVIATVDVMKEKSSSYAAADDDSQRAALLRFISEAATVEHAQLQSIAGDLHQTEEQLLSSVDAVQRQIRLLDDECLSLREFERLAVSFNGFIQNLLDATTGVHDIVGDTAASIDRAFTEIQPLGGRTSNVTATMRELSAHIGVIALNAQVQAAQIQEVTGLEVLAAATNRVAIETGGISEEMAIQLDRFTSNLDDMVRTMAGIREDHLAQKSKWEMRLERDRTELHAMRDDTLAELEATVTATDRIRTLTAAMREKVALRSMADARLENALAALQQTALAAEGMLQSSRLTNTSPASSGDFERIYTMESERRVSEAALATIRGGGKQGPQIPSSPSSDSANSNLNSNSLAVTVSASPSGAGPSVTKNEQMPPVPAVPDSSSRASDTAIAPRQGEPADSTENVTSVDSAEPKKEFGENVDLF